MPRNMKIRIRTSHRLAIILSLAVGITLLASSSAPATTVYWDDTGSGSWFLSGHWNPMGRPASGDDVYIRNGGTATIASNLMYNATCNTLNVGGGASAVDMTGDTLTANSEYLGNGYGTGAFFQSGGTNTTSYLTVGYSDNAGSYNLSAGTLSVAGNETIGYYTTGTMTQSGGTHTVSASSSSGALRLGMTTSGNGTYNLSGGTLTAYGEYIYQGSGTFNQSGGTNTITGPYGLNLWAQSGCMGIYNLTGGTLITKTITGGGSTNRFDFGGGTLQAAADFSPYVPMNLTGVNGNANIDTAGYTVTMTGPMSGVGGLNKNGAGTFAIIGSATYTGNTIVNAGTLSVGNNGSLNGTQNIYVYSGAMAQSWNANVTVPNTLNVGTAYGLTGSYELNTNGTLSAGYEYIGGPGVGSFTHTKGTNSVGHVLYIGNSTTGSGNYQMTDWNATLNAPAECVGYSGPGTFTQNGGYNTVTDTLYLGNVSGGNGTYNLNAGYLNTPNLYIGCGGPGTFNHNGGVNSTTNTLFLGYSSAPGAYNLGGGGTLNANVEYVGYYGTGTFVQNGGLNTANVIAMGYFAGNNSYTLNGGSLSTGGEYVGVYNTGTFTQNGGSHTIGAEGLCLGYGSTGNGTFNLNGGTLALRSLTKGTGAAQFNFGAATLQANADFTTSLPMTLTGTGGNATVHTNGHVVEFSGSLTGNGGLTKTGVGMLTLSGANMYYGATTVSRGTLNVSGSITSATTVNSGATLAGNGTVGAVTVNNGGILAPGASIGTLTVAGNLALAADAILAYELESPAHSDLISMSGSTLSITGLDLDNFTFSYSDLVAGTYTLIDALSITGSLGTALTTTLDGLVATLAFSHSGDDLILTLRDAAVVPEPASMLIWGTAGLLGLAFARRRNRAA